MTHIFISYSRKDLTFVERLTKDLRSAGFEVWYDLSNLEFGKNWGREIEAALHRSQCLIVVLSPNSRASRWVEREYLFAENLNMTIIPLLYEHCELPLWTVDLHYIDMTTGEYKKRLKELLLVLGKPEKRQKEKKPETVPAAAPEPVIVEPKEESVIEPVKPEPIKFEVPPVVAPPEVIPAVTPVEREQETAPPVVEEVHPPVEPIVPLVLSEPVRHVPEPEPVTPAPAPEAVKPVIQAEAEMVEKPQPREEEKAEVIKPRPSAARKPRWGYFAAGGAALLALIVFFAGRQLGWFPMGKTPQAPATSAPATLTAATSTGPAPTATAAYVISNVESAKAFADPIRGYVADLQPDLYEPFDTEQEYWDRLVWADDEALEMATLKKNGVLNLRNAERGDFKISVNEMYYTEEENKVIGNTFVFQYEFCLNSTYERNLIKTVIWGYDMALEVSLNPQSGVEVILADQQTTGSSKELGKEVVTAISQGDWHTLQLITFDHSLAIYLDDSPIYYGEKVDPRPGGVGIGLYFQGEGIDVDLDNITLWDLSSSYAAKPFAEPIRQWAAVTEPDAKEDFSTTPVYWDEMVTYDIGDQRTKADVTPEGGVLSLTTTADQAKSYMLHLNVFDIFPVKDFILQYDFKTGIQDLDSGIELTFDELASDLGVSISLQDHYPEGYSLKVSQVGRSGDIQILGRSYNIDITASQWHTLQYIFYNQTLAVYLDDRPVFYQEQVDFGMVEGIYISISTQQRLDLSLDNFQVWSGVRGISSVDGMEMVYVPAGAFTMGSDSGDPNAAPAHQVSLSAYWIDSTEVTNTMYMQCVADNSCDPPKETSSYTREDYFGNPEYSDYPVVWVNWNMAKAYCEWAGRRLPTEAEWEKAARGTDGRIYPWGNEFDNKRGNFQNIVGDTTAVKSYESGKSFYGAYDMAGNVWEWVADLYSWIYYSVSPVDDPKGPSGGDKSIIRGGTFAGGAVELVSYFRMPMSIDYMDYAIGFRCATSGGE